MKQQPPHKAREIAAELASLPLQEAAAVLAQAQLLILDAEPGKARASAVSTAKPINPHLLRLPKDRSIISRNPEIVRLLDGLDRYYTLDGLVGLLQDKFGPQRGLNRSCLHRYIQRRASEARGQRRTSK